MTNTEIVLSAMNELFGHRDLTALDRYWQEPYIQHNPTMTNGLDGLRTVVPRLRDFSWVPLRVVAEGDLVMVHCRVVGWTKNPAIVVDVFRLLAGRIVEHWDVVQEEVPMEKTASGNPMA